mmetsp:Transcript_17287/g.48688  ORF Transcript_17287/g.48688 Transcript_17287/m.48688 type:complete len:209 (+) Transcript_17287:1690-2316(+)
MMRPPTEAVSLDSNVGERARSMPTSTDAASAVSKSRSSPWGDDIDRTISRNLEPSVSMLSASDGSAFCEVGVPESAFSSASYALRRLRMMMYAVNPTNASAITMMMAMTPSSRPLLLPPVFDLFCALTPTGQLLGTDPLTYSQKSPSYSGGQSHFMVVCEESTSSTQVPLLAQYHVSETSCGKEHLTSAGNSQYSPTCGVDDVEQSQK